MQIDSVVARTALPIARKKLCAANDSQRTKYPIANRRIAVVVISNVAASGPSRNSSASTVGKQSMAIADTTDTAVHATKQHFSIENTRLRSPAPQLKPIAGCSESHEPYIIG